MVSKKFHIVSIVCSLIALIFSAIAVISADKSTRTIESLSWGLLDYKYDSYSYDVEAHYFVGIFAVVFKYNADALNYNFYDSSVTEKVTFASSDCTGSLCDDCRDGNRAVLALLVVSVAAALVATILSFLRYFGNDSCGYKTGQIVAASLSMTFGVASLIVFASVCMAKLVKEYEDDDNMTFHYGSAFSLLATAVCLMFFVVIFGSIVGVNAEANNSACCANDCACCEDNAVQPNQPMPMVVAAAPPGQVYMAQPGGGQPVMYYGQVPGQPQQPQMMMVPQQPQVMMVPMQQQQPAGVVYATVPTEEKAI